jgi:predicted RNA-binding Zn-ribbon protein involved in translation (DUF1610 family)
MAVTIPTEDQHPTGTVEWTCTHCGHHWEGKSKRERQNPGNPTCSNCGRRSGATRATRSESPDPDTEPDQSEIDGLGVLVALAAIGTQKLISNHRNRGKM